MRIFIKFIVVCGFIFMHVTSHACANQSVCMSWDEVTQSTDGKALPSKAWYNVYRVQGSQAVLIRTTPAGQLAITEGGQPVGKQCYYVTAVATLSGKASESGPSGTGCTTIRLPAPTDGKIEGPTDGAIEQH